MMHPDTAVTTAVTASSPDCHRPSGQASPTTTPQTATDFLVAAFGIEPAARPLPWGRLARSGLIHATGRPLMSSR